MSLANVLKRENFPYLLTIMFAVVAWGITHIVDSLLKAPILEYNVAKQARGKNTTFEYSFTNISRTKQFQDLEISFVLSSNEGLEFLQDSCKIKWIPPLKHGEPAVKEKDTFKFTIPQFHPNCRIKVVMTVSGKGEPTLHYKSNKPESVLLEKGSIYTFIAKNERGIIIILIGILILLMIIYFLYLFFSKSNIVENNEKGQVSGH
jgi:hypothetical protein